LCAVACVVLKEEDKLGLDIDADLLDKKLVLKKKLKDDLNNEDDSIGFGGGISGKQMAINAYNTLIKMLVK
jgi:hypothetical protein